MPTGTSSNYKVSASVKEGCLLNRSCDDSIYFIEETKWDRLIKRGVSIREAFAFKDLTVVEKNVALYVPSKVFLCRVLSSRSHLLHPEDCLLCQSNPLQD